MKLKLILATLATTSTIASATTIFSSDFETDLVANPASDTLNDGWFFNNVIAGNANSTTDTNEHRTYDAPAGVGARYGSRGWISSVTDAYITVDLGILSSDTIYTVDYFAGSETSNAANDVIYLAELLVGGSVDTATSVSSDSGTDIGDGGGKNVDEMHTFNFTSLTANGSDHIYLKIGRDGGSSFIFIDDVNVDASSIPEPSSLALLSLGSLALIRRRR